MTLKSKLTLLVLMLLLPVLLLTGCASESPQLTVSSPLIPALPLQARQPTLPPECQPKTCSQGFSTWLDATQQTPMPPALPASPVSTPTKH